MTHFRERDPSRRVVITGIGLVSPLGLGVEENWNRLKAGESGIGPITKFDCSDYPVQIAGEVRDFDPTNWVSRKDLKKMDLFIQYAMAASSMALEDADYTVTPEEAERVGVLIGSGIGGITQIEKQHETLLNRGPGRVSPFFIPAIIVNLASGQVSIQVGAKGPNSATCTACATGNHALGDAAALIRRGDADVMIAGGAESAVCGLAMAGFSAMRALSARNDDPTKASRPFDTDRDGFVLAEGAGVLLLESLEHAQKRGARIYAEVAGYGLTGDAFHISAPAEDGNGAIRVMNMALEDGGLTASDVDYVNAHGTSTPVGDRLETMALKKLLGDRAQEVLVSSSKSMSGHLLGAAGGLESAVTALALYHGLVPPTINLDNPDPECDLNYVPHKAVERDIKVALNNGFGFGGTNACLAMAKYEDS